MSLWKIRHSSKAGSKVNWGCVLENQKAVTDPKATSFVILFISKNFVKEREMQLV